jgi:hypothetical protein
MIFTVVFYGLTIFGCKTVQLCATRCEWHCSGLPGRRKAVQQSENARKTSFLNYESPALTAELQARRALKREHPIFNVQRPIFNLAEWFRMASTVGVSGESSDLTI